MSLTARLLLTALLLPGCSGEAVAPAPTAEPPRSWSACDGGDHVCVLRGEEVLCSGDNRHGELGDGSRGSTDAWTRVPGLRARAVFCGRDATCATTVAGQLVCWGNLTSPSGSRVHLQPMVVEGLPRNVRDVAIGWRRFCARTESGEVLCWGEQPPTPREGIGRATSLSGVGGGFCATTEEGWWCWQEAQDENLRRIEGAPPLVGMSASEHGGCGLDEDGVVYCFGDTLVDGNDTGGAIQVPDLPAASVVAVGNRFACVQERGTEHIRCIGSSEGRTGPRFVTAEGDLLTPRCRGVGAGLRCGAWANPLTVADMARVEPRPPIAVAPDAPRPAAWVSPRALFARPLRCELDSNGRVSCADIEDRDLAEQLNGVVELEAGTDYFCARRTDGSVWCWGSNRFGRFGSSATTTSRADRPLRFFDVDDATQISIGWEPCVLATNGHVRCSRGDPARLRPVVGVEGAVEIATHHFTSCARTRDGHVLCWGENRSGEVGRPASRELAPPGPTVPAIDDAVALRGRGETFCVVHGDARSATCWGRDPTRVEARGPEGITTPRYDRPTAIDGMTGLRDLAMAHDFVCAINGERELWCWGQEPEGEERGGPRRVSEGLSADARLSCGHTHCCVHAPDAPSRCIGSRPGSRAPATGWIPHVAGSQPAPGSTPAVP